MPSGGVPLGAALICFLIYFGNVALGAAGLGAPLDDLAEMLTLFASSIFFVIGILMREAAAKQTESNT